MTVNSSLPGGLLFFSSMLLLLFSPHTGNAEKNQDPLNSEWVQKDREVMQHLRKNLPPQSSKASLLVDILNEGNDAERRDIGFGNERYDFRQGGGYVSCSLSVLSHKDIIAAVRVDCSDDHPDIQIIMMGVWGSDGIKMSYGLRYEFVQDDILKQMKDAVKNELGKVEPGSIAEEFEDEYSLLMDPFPEYDFGRRCYYSGKPPQGRVAIRTLIEGGQIDLIRSSLRSLNPEGRAYAAEALIKLRRAGYSVIDNDLDAIKKVRNSEILLSTCYGCIVQREKARDILPSLALTKEAAHVVLFHPLQVPTHEVEILVDFLFYREKIVSWIDNLGIAHSFYADESFEVEVRPGKTIQFSKKDFNSDYGFILIKPDGNYKILYGVHTDVDFMYLAKDYFGIK